MLILLLWCFMSSCVPMTASTKLPVDGAWSEWQSIFDSCNSVTCGHGGKQILTRQCNNPYPAFLGKYCEGASVNVTQCFKNPCLVNGSWSEWQAGDCSVTCGGGTKIARRRCTNPAPLNGGATCEGKDELTEQCNTQACGINYYCLQKWILHNDQCYLDADQKSSTSHIGLFICQGKSKHNNKIALPILKTKEDASFYNKSKILLHTDKNYMLGGSRSTTGIFLWSDSTKLDDGYTNWAEGYPKMGEQGVYIQPNGKWKSYSYSTETAQIVCQAPAAKVTWSVYSNCSGACGGGAGKQTRTPEICNGTADICNDMKETRDCHNATPCPVDGTWSEWTLVTCGATCGKSTGIYQRECKNVANLGNFCEGENTKIQSCSSIECPVHGGWSAWAYEDGIECSATCGAGVSLMSRRCDSPYPAFGGAVCTGAESKGKYCSLKPCSTVSWTVIQKRVNDSTSFQRTWTEYENGFGSPSGNYWMGLKQIYELTKNGFVKIRFEMRKFNDDKLYWSEYDKFKISGASAKYELSISDYNKESTAGDSMKFHNGMQFSTIDNDNDKYRKSCSKKHGKSGWWFKNCFHSNPNGMYFNKGKSNSKGVVWSTLTNRHTALQYFRILIFV